MKEDSGKLEQDVTSEQVDAERRKFINTAGKAAIVAPAVGLLLSVEGAQAGGAGPYEIELPPEFEPEPEQPPV